MTLDQLNALRGTAPNMLQTLSTYELVVEVLARLDLDNGFDFVTDSQRRRLMRAMGINPHAVEWARCPT